MSTLLKDVIHIKERAGDEDYVLRLTDSVGEGARRALEQYFVTPALVDAFDQALGLVAEAIGSDTSRGAFLTGSFGSGKSHFMAVLHALLRQDPAARGKQELQPVVARHDPALRDKKVLPLAFHLLGATSLEQAIFDGYIRQVRDLHPDAPLPAVHKSDQLLADAEGLRARLGDTPFLAGLNGESAGSTDAADDPGDIWGAVLGSGTWDLDSYHQARAAAPESEQRQRLVSALVEHYYTAYTRQAEHLDLDTGLAAIAEHAKSLGYDAVVLFLDELVLWLAFTVQDQSFFGRESQKITKLVESNDGRRAIPLVSVIARQMDLRRWFADSGASGAQQEALDRAFRHQEGRFSVIKLGDDNLPAVAHERLLKPVDDRAERVVQDAFEHLERRPEVWDVLLDGANTDESHRGADERAFRLTYPFSPALVSTLRSLASVMQRERTALKVMQQMLVERRESLTVDDVIPVGDAFEHIVNGQSPLDSTSAALFNSARRLYAEKLQPLLLSNNGLTKSDVESAARGETTLPASYLADDRLARTLLLSAVAPKVPALKQLTPSRLASLNHGSIKSPLPGNEKTVVLSKIKDWARTIPEIHVDSDAKDPAIRVQLVDVDYESIVEKAKGEDNAGRRRELVKDLLADMLDVPLGAPNMFGAHTHEIVWRGSRREVDLVFGNVRDASWLTDEHFTARPGTWRLVIDHPFDEEGHSSAEDEARVDRLISVGDARQTVVWLPRFLSAEKMKELRRLVILDWLLTGNGERWETHADHLSELDRAQSKTILQAQHSALREGLRRTLEQAYGIVRPAPGILVDDGGHERMLTSLDRGFDPGAPKGTSMAAAFASLVERAYASSFPGHPRFEPGDREVRLPDLRAVHQHLVRAMADPDKRVPLEGDASAVRRVANALGVGHGSETHFNFGDDRFSPWGNELARARGREDVSEDTVVTAGQVRRWVDSVEPLQGLRPEVTDLVILAWAMLRERAWFHHGGAVEAPQPGKVHDAMELRPQPMPTQAEWAGAVEGVGTLLGRKVSGFLTPPAVASLAVDVHADIAELVAPAQELVAMLEDAYRKLDLSTDDPGRSADRLATAREAATLVASLRQLKGVTLVRRLAEVGASGRGAALGTSLRQATEVVRALRNFHWRLVDSLRSHPDDVQGRQILGHLASGLADDQIVTRAQALLESSGDQTVEWLAGLSPTATAPAPGPTTPSTSRGPGPGLGPDHIDVELPDPRRAVDPNAVVIRGRGSHRAHILERLSSFFDAHQDDEVEVTWRVVE